MKLRKCPECKRYTLKEVCRSCESATITPAPPKFSPVDKFGRWRRKLIKKEYN
ncbi:MAG: RNA-protein complex protein Nop10 [Candidatus Aenigmarchaeota archaeon]|nr:RNA-protein complex protein Nop10 [Candidatus Aenigmarchaeota archaeon]